MTGGTPDPHPDSPPANADDVAREDLERGTRADPGVDDVDAPRPAPDPDGSAGGSGGEVRNQGDDAQ